MNGENKMETVEVKHENLQELYKVLTNYPAISKEQVIHELHKCFGKEAFKLKDVTYTRMEIMGPFWIKKSARCRCLP